MVINFNKKNLNVMKLKTLFLFVLLGCTLQLHAQCTNYAGADPIAFDSDICPGASIGFDIFIFTNDVPIGEFYDIQITGSDGSVGFGFAFDDGFGFGDLLPNPVEGCESILPSCVAIQERFWKF